MCLHVSTFLLWEIVIPKSYFIVCTSYSLLMGQKICFMQQSCLFQRLEFVTVVVMNIQFLMCSLVFTDENVHKLYYKVSKVKVPSYYRPWRSLRENWGITPLFFVNLGTRWVWVVNATPRPLYPRERPSTHCTGGWVGLGASLDRRGKSRPHRDSIPGPSSS